MNRMAIAELILARLEALQSELSAAYANSKTKIGHFIADDLLPDQLAQRAFNSFPAAGNMRLRKTLREFKYSAAQMNEHDPLLEELIFAFQDSRVVKMIAKICEIETLFPDEHLYAGGISLMGNKQFLNPHLDNSHDKDRQRWRVLNLLYYVTPDWPADRGGNLELWPNGVKNTPITIHSKFNRLVVMATHDASWHSVNPISFAGNARCCVSNYYFSDHSLNVNESFHITSFRGRPEQKIRDIVLQADARIRLGVRRVFAKGIVETRHLYKKSK